MAGKQKKRTAATIYKEIGVISLIVVGLYCLVGGADFLFEMEASGRCFPSAFDGLMYLLAWAGRIF